MWPNSVVLTNGCFDMLHEGHAAMLRVAADMGDMLVVGLNSDASVKRLKGSRRPIVSQDARKFMLESLWSVDKVVIYDEETADAFLTQQAACWRCVNPDAELIYVKGGDRRPLPEQATLDELGIKAQFLGVERRVSTTQRIADVINSILRGLELDT